MRYWRGNEHWMVRDRDADPERDPEEGCECCGWRDESEDVAKSDLIWIPAEHDTGFPGAWFCMECD